jgi:hypothetical protein
MILLVIIIIVIMRSSMVPRTISTKLSNVGQSFDGWPKIYYLDFLRASKGMLSRWFRQHLQLLAPTNPYWARVVGNGPFFLSVIHKEGLCPIRGNINRLMMNIITSQRRQENRPPSRIFAKNGLVITAYRNLHPIVGPPRRRST